ncbi:hypothetical protein [Ruminococcus sp. NK3A76]|uniref:hypothetical protein n=1 Tax=Ruminococcus sp. NK3A76 TaxID=877411 RepID=UPI0004903A19|nr:hypothetical protein [Ruminococcus sp. NK3A76]
MLRRCISAAVAVSLLLCSCSSSENGGDDGVGLAVVDNGGPSFSPNVPAYGYPSFLERIEPSDSLSNINYRSFDPSQLTEVTTQPFEDKECLQAYSGRYIYKEGSFVGVLDSDGSVIMQADTFAKAEFVSPTMLRMYLYDFEGSDFVYADISDKNDPKIEETHTFKSSNIRTSERRVEDSDRVLLYIVANGVTVGQTGYDSVSQKDVSELPSDISCQKAYTVTKDGAYYIIAFDEFYNYTVYEGTYAKIDLSIAGKPGSCYIMSYEDNIEAKTLIDSFARSEDDNSDTRDDDYISFDFGLYGDDDYIVTLYSSGKLISQGTKDGSQFYSSAKVDTRCFGDLIRWVDSTVSKEYSGTTA